MVGGSVINHLRKETALVTLQPTQTFQNFFSWKEKLKRVQTVFFGDIRNHIE